jgi:hypothetical protein
MIRFRFPVAVRFPVRRIGLDVPAAPVEIAVVTNDVVVEARLPQRSVVGLPIEGVHALAEQGRGHRFEPVDDIAQRWIVGRTFTAREDNRVDVVGHHHERVDGDAGEMGRGFAPGGVDHDADGVEHHEAIDHVTEEPFAPLGDHGDRIRSGRPVIPPRQPDVSSCWVITERHW